MKQLYGMRLCMFVMVLIASRAFSMTIGSDSAVTNFVTQQVLLNGYRIAGFAGLGFGFALVDATTTGTFDTFFSVGRSVQLNQGTLLLYRDLMMEDGSQLTSLGNIAGRGYVLDLAASITAIPGPPSGGSSGCIPTQLTTVNQPASIRCDGWSYDSSYVAIGMASIIPASILLRVYQRVGSSLVLRASSPLIVPSADVNALDWHPSQFWIATGQETVLVSNELNIIAFDPVLGTLTFLSGVNLGVDIRAVAWHPSGSYLAVGRDVSGIIVGEVAIYSVSNTGIINPVPIATYNPTGNRSVGFHALSWDATGTYLAVGLDNGVGPNLAVLTFVPSPASLTVNAQLASPGNAMAVNFNQVFSNLLVVGYSTGTERVSIYQHNPIAGTVTLLTSISNSGNQPQDLQWSPNGVCIAGGWTGNLFETYKYNPTLVTVTRVYTQAIAGTTNTVSWSPNGASLSCGGTSNILYLFSVNEGNLPIVTGGCVTFSDLTMRVHSNILFHDCCITFSGISAINGNGNMITLSPTSTFIVAPNSTLSLQNIMVAGVTTNRLTTSAASSVINFENVGLELGGAYQFGQGSFRVTDELLLTGTGQFIYSTNRTSTIDSASALIVDSGVTFSYVPSVAANNLLMLTDRTSIFSLMSGTLYIGTMGLQFTKGSCIADQYSSLIATGTGTQGFVLGDGLSSSNNSTFVIRPDATFDLVSGAITYKNV